MSMHPSGRDLAPTSSRESGLVPVHIGQPEPGSEREQALLQQLAHTPPVEWR